MWIFLKDAFLSIVVPEPMDVPDHLRNSDVLAVRARWKGDIERVFPKARVMQWKGRDYAFRAFIPRKYVARAMEQQVQMLKATNFKASVTDDARHDAYMAVWGVMHRFQQGQFHAQARERASRFRGDDHGYGPLFGHTGR